jgi:hypothetical protein
MPIRDSKMLLSSALDGFAANTNSTYEVNFGIAHPNCAKNGKFGCHIVIHCSYTDLDEGGEFIVMHGAAVAPATPLISRIIPVADMTINKHFFIPFPPTNLQYVRLKTVPVSTTSTNGTHTAWLGPDEDGTE